MLPPSHLAVKSTCLHADDIALYCIITSPNDYAMLQEDISAVSSFLNYKYLNFNVDKCRAMHITRKRSNSIPPPPLYLNSTKLMQVTNYKYLGVIITNTLSWQPHIVATCKKTRKLIGMLYRSLYQHSSPKTLLKLYLTKIRPHLEYASPVWDPFRKGEIEELENVQKFALRMCLKSWDMDYSELLEKAHIPTLSSRRSRASLRHLTKIVKNQTYFPEVPITVRQNPYYTI